MICRALALLSLCTPAPVVISRSMITELEPVRVEYPRLCIAMINHEGVAVIINDGLDEATFKILASRLRAENVEPVQCPMK